MHTIMMVTGGLVLLLVAFVLSRWLGGRSAAAAAAKYFIPIWLVIALINIWIGVSRAGYTIAQETPILLIVFAVPAGVAAFIWRKHS